MLYRMDVEVDRSLQNRPLNILFDTLVSAMSVRNLPSFQEAEMLLRKGRRGLEDEKLCLQRFVALL